MTDLTERLTQAAAAAIADEAPDLHHAAEQALDGLRELAWRRRADAIRARRHAAPGTRAFVRLKPRMRATGAAAYPVAGVREA